MPWRWGWRRWRCGGRRGHAPVLPPCYFSPASCCSRGSLYLLALTGIRAFGFITPLGGLAFIFGWLALGLAALKLEEP